MVHNTDDVEKIELKELERKDIREDIFQSNEKEYADSWIIVMAKDPRF